MKVFNSDEELEIALHVLIEAGLVDSVIMQGDALFKLSDSITNPGMGAIGALLRAVQAIADPCDGSQ